MEKHLIILIALSCLMINNVTAVSLNYWQQTVDKDKKVSNPVFLKTVKAENYPSKDNPVEITPKPVEGAVQYIILRIPTEAPKNLTVEVVNKGHDTVYYWIFGHAGVYRSAIGGPAIAKNCAKNNIDNNLQWDVNPKYQEYTILRTDSPEMPTGKVNSAITWGLKSKTGKFTDKNSARTLLDTRCYPDGMGTSVFMPVGNAAFCVGQSDGKAIKDTGILKNISIKNAETIVQQEDNIYQVNNAKGQGGLKLEIDNKTPYGQYGWGGPRGIYIHQRDFGGGHNEYNHYYSAKSKSFHIPLMIWQDNFTPGQVTNLCTFSYKYGEGDHVHDTVRMQSSGLIEDHGDEGSEFFCYGNTRILEQADMVLMSDADKYATSLSVNRIPKVGSGRIIVNLSKVNKQGTIVKIDDDMKVGQRKQYGNNDRVTRLTGKGTNWSPEMIGWYISINCDTRKDGIRQWYRVVKVYSPTSMDIYAYTYFSNSTYLGHAQNVEYHGKEYRGGIRKSYKFEPRPANDKKTEDATEGEAFLLAPTAVIADPAKVGKDIHVLPLSQAWQKNDKLQMIAGPHIHLGYGYWHLTGKLLPQDFVTGLNMRNWTDRLSNDAALEISGKWCRGVDVQLDDQGLSEGVTVLGKANPDGGAFVASADTNALKILDVPVVLSGNSETKEIVFSENNNAGPKVLAIGSNSVSVGDNVSLKGGNQLRGRVTLAGDGQNKAFTVKFPAKFATKPYVVASSNLPIGMGVSSISEASFVATFATAPEKGASIEITWIVME